MRPCHSSEKSRKLWLTRRDEAEKSPEVNPTQKAFFLSAQRLREIPYQTMVGERRIHVTCLMAGVILGTHAMAPAAPPTEAQMLPPI